MNAYTHHLPLAPCYPVRMINLGVPRWKGSLLTWRPGGGAREPPVELLVLSLLSLLFGLENDLKISDCSRFKARGFSAFFFDDESFAAAWEVNLLELPLDEGLFAGLGAGVAAFESDPFAGELLILLVITIGVGMAGLFPVLRYFIGSTGSDLCNGTRRHTRTCELWITPY